MASSSCGSSGAATITLAGRTYPVERRGDVRYVDGIPTREFVERLESEGNWAALTDLANIGHAKLSGELPAGSARVAAGCLHAARAKTN